MSQPLRIGKFELANPVLLAPMAGVSDEPFRALCRQHGAALAASEMTTADTRLWDSPKSAGRLTFGKDESPRALQLAGSEPTVLADAARRGVDLGAQIIDINMGCPAKKVCKRLAGSALLRDEDLVRRILKSVVAAVDVPVTLKFRTGWSRSERNGVRIAQIAEQSGVCALAVHGRTRGCAYNEPAEYETIKAIKAAVCIPVFANGDIDSPQKARDVMNVTKADGVMLGRAACGRPWIFFQVAKYLAKNICAPPPSLSLRRDIVCGHLDAMYRFYGEQKGVRVARKHLTWYCQHLASADGFRERAVRAENSADQMRLTRRFFDGCIAREGRSNDRPSNRGASRQWQNRRRKQTARVFAKNLSPI